MTYNLLESWNKTFDMFSEDIEYRDICFENIYNFYSGGRYYHNLEHISSCFKELEDYNGHAFGHCDSVYLRLAIWLHDVIYDSKSINNEEMSVNFAKLILIGGKALPTISDKVSELIMLTKHNVNTDNISFEGKLLLDIDLSILGKDRKTFNKYELDIRKEYSWVDDKRYFNGRLVIINSFMNRDKIYNTKYFSDKYEKQARDNLNYSKANLVSLLNNY